MTYPIGLPQDETQLWCAKLAQEIADRIKEKFGPLARTVTIRYDNIGTSNPHAEYTVDFGVREYHIS